MHLFRLKTKRLILYPANVFIFVPEDYRDAFCVAGGAFGRPCCM